MKKKLFIVATAALSVFIVICGYLFVDSLFPKAEPLSISDDDTVISLSVTSGEKCTDEVKEANYEKILQAVISAKPTRRQSVNDSPTAEAYLTADIVTSSREYRCYIYTEGSDIYVEIPYEGIYKAEKQAIDLLRNIFKTEKTF